MNVASRLSNISLKSTDYLDHWIIEFKISKKILGALKMMYMGRDKVRGGDIFRIYSAYMQNMQDMQNMQNLQTKPSQTYQTKPTKPKLPNQTYKTKPTRPNQT